MKTTWPILLSLLLLAAPAAVQAQYAYSTNADGSANIVAYAGPPWVVTIPTNINGLTVTSIGTYAFAGTSLTSVTIPNSVTSIVDDAFQNCTGLTNATIDNGVTIIGEGAFAGCTSLTSVTIPNSVTIIELGAFSDCTSLTNATILNGVASIGVLAFTGTALTSVTIPGSVTSIGNAAFYNCTNLTSVYFPGNSPTPNNNTTVFAAGNYPYGYDPATVYYLPGTTGWGAMFDSRPTAPWFLATPQILNNGDILIQFSGGVPGALYDVEESSDLLTWTAASLRSCSRKTVDRSG